MQNNETPEVIEHVLEFYRQHQVHPRYVKDTPSGYDVYRKCLYELLSGGVALLDVSVQVQLLGNAWQPTGRRKTVTSLFEVNSTYSEYRENTEVVDGAFHSYLQLFELDALSEYLDVHTFSTHMLLSKHEHTRMNADAWLLSILLKAHTVQLQCLDWNKHKSTLDRVISCYNRFGTVFVLNKMYQDFRPLE